ncbi:MAG TPA: universal stress protein, partial [Pyrinomonadaceae bacterium]|nr:universal stress protein [Pyrinomonadaceae bacterium]
PDSHLAVEQAAKRAWNPGSEVRLVSAIELDFNSVHENFPKFESELKKAEKLRREASALFEQNGLRVSTTVKTGRAKNILVKEAKDWDADCIFLGAKGHRFLERILLGSVSYAVTARAHCSVEVVRGELNAVKE